MEIARKPVSRAWQSTAVGIYWRVLALDRFELDASILDAFERTRAFGFHFYRDRQRYIAAHVAMRLSLCEVLDLLPAQLVISHGPNGKPMLPKDCGWGFNFSHSEDIAIIAAAPSTETDDIGIDIERTRRISKWRSLAQSTFSEVEKHSIREVPFARASQTFLRCWTRKEACVKALGTGLTISLNGFTAGVGPEEVSVHIEADSFRHSLRVRTLFDDDRSIAALAWRPRKTSGHMGNNRYYRSLVDIAYETDMSPWT